MKDEPYYKCEKCGEEFATEKQARKTEKDIRAMKEGIRTIGSDFEKDGATQI